MQTEHLNGSKSKIVPYNSKHLLQALNKPSTKEVHVFRLTPGMIIEIKNKPYQVISLNSKGKKAVLHLSRVS